MHVIKFFLRISQTLMTCKGHNKVHLNSLFTFLKIFLILWRSCFKIVCQSSLSSLFFFSFLAFPLNLFFTSISVSQSTKDPLKLDRGLLGNMRGGKENWTKFLRKVGGKKDCQYFNTFHPIHRCQLSWYFFKKCVTWI